MRILFLVAVSLIVMSTVGYAQEANIKCCMGQGQCKSEHSLERLGLTPEQKVKVDELEMQTQKAIIPVKAEIELKRIDLEKEMKLDNPNRDRVMKMVKDIHALELQMKQAMVDQRLNIHGILTPEQRAQMQKPLHQGMRMNMMEKQGGGQSNAMKEPCAGCKDQGETGKPCPHHKME